MTGTVPKNHLSSGNAVDVIAEVAVGTEDNLFAGREGIHNLAGIPRSHDYIRKSLHCGRSIHI